MRPLKIFISSPMDVSAERTVARRVIDRLALEFAYHFRIEPVMSELEPIMATQTPQASITPPSDTDIVIVLVWARLGTPLPEDPRFEINSAQRQPTGTEWEFYDAFRAHQAKGQPDLLVYRKTERVTADLDDEQQVLDRLGQKRELERFLDQWFRSPDGTWKAWFHSFEKEEELEHLLEIHLRKLIESRIDVDPSTDDTPTIKVIEGNPYRGLRSFNVEDAPLFFGRTRALNELREVLETQNALRRGFVIVTGGSGSGKSSLVKAGLLADLQNPHRIGRVALCRHAIMRPTDQSGQLLLALAHALMQNTAFPELHSVGWKPEELAQTASQEPQRLIEALQHAANVAARGAKLRDVSDMRLCLIVDQLEELFTAGIPPSTINEFTRLITLLARSEVVWVVATLRSDFYHRLDETPDLLLLVERGYYRLKAPLPTELGQMIRKPAQLAGLRFQKHPETGIALDAVLQDDAVSDPTALPLLEFALTELWNQRSPEGLLTFDAYERMGRMTGAIAERAEGLIASLSLGSQQHLAPTLRALITVGRTDAAPTAAMVHRSRIAITIERAEILDKLINARLVVTDDLENRGDPKCRLAHEKLIETWPRLRKIAAEDRVFLEIRTRLRAAAEAWADRGRKRDFLLPQGSLLTEGESTLKTRHDELDPLIVEFVQASITAERDARTRKLRRMGVLASAFAVIAIIAAIGLVRSELTKREVVRQQRALVEKEQQALADAERANRGFGVAIRATTVLNENTGAAGGKLDQVMDNADNFLEDTIKASSAPPNILEQRAALLLSFAKTNERLGDYPKQRERLRMARGMLEPICSADNQDNIDCRMLLADSYDAEGNYFWRMKKQDEAVHAYERALQIRPTPEPTSDRRADLLLARAETVALLAQAHASAEANDEALKLAESCLDIVKQAEGTGTEELRAALITGQCHFIAAEVTSDDTEAVQRAKLALDKFEGLHSRDSHDVHVATRLAVTKSTIARRLYRLGKKDAASGEIAEAVRLLGPIVRSNPQNDETANWLQRLLQMQGIVYSNLGRHDLAAKAREERVELAKSRRKAPRWDHWRDIYFDSLGELGTTYKALDRPQDALDQAEAEVSERRAGLLKESEDAAYPVAMIAALNRAGARALEAKSGVKAYGYSREALAQAERNLAGIARSGRREAGYSEFDTQAYIAVYRLSQLTTDMLPPEQRIDMLSGAVARIERVAKADPRNIGYRQALGNALHELALAYDLSDELTASREAHERASKSGNHLSTIVLRRWYLEGKKGLKPNQARARELETLAKKQSEVPSWNIEVKVRSTGKTEHTTVFIPEPTGSDFTLADEEHRLSRYWDAEITENGRTTINKIIDFATEHKETVGSVLTLLKGADNDDTLNTLPQTPITTQIEEVYKLLAEKNFEVAYERLVAARNVLDQTEQMQNVTAWALLAEAFFDFGFKLKETSKEPSVSQTAWKSDVLGQQAEADEGTAVKRALGVSAEGTSPRLALAQNLEAAAARAAQRSRGRTAIELLWKAISERQVVHTEDPKNAACACLIAKDLEKIAEIERNLYTESGTEADADAAVDAMQRAIKIYEDLGRNELVAPAALQLAEMYRERGEPRSALLNARKAVNIKREVAALDSASSKTRMDYAHALEQQAWSAKMVAENEPRKSDEKGQRRVNSHLELAIFSLHEANAIRESVLVVDPKNGECRCNMANNMATLDSLYQALGKEDEWRKTLEDTVSMRRLVLSGSPDNAQWKYSLGDDLIKLARSFYEESIDRYARQVPLYEEAVALLRPLISNDAFKELAAALTKDSLFSLSFLYLFLSKPTDSLNAANEALEIDGGEEINIMILTNKAHALMYLDQTEEAREIYRSNLGKQIRDSTWDREISNDFNKLRAAGLTHPLMDEIQPMLQID